MFDPLPNETMGDRASQSDRPFTLSNFSTSSNLTTLTPFSSNFESTNLSFSAINDYTQPSKDSNCIVNETSLH